jgi:hypothetical protein
MKNYESTGMELFLLLQVLERINLKPENFINLVG